MLSIHPKRKKILEKKVSQIQLKKSACNIENKNKGFLSSQSAY